MQDISSQGGRTVLFVSHDMVAIQNLCNKGLLLANGTVKSYGEVNNIIKDYLLVDEINKGHDLCYDLTLVDKYVDSQSFELEKLEIVDDNLGKGFQISSCNSCKFKVYYNTDELIGKSIKIGITIKDDFHKPLITFNSTFINENLLSEESGFISCSVNEFNLVPGDYTIHIWFVIDNDKEIIIENAGSVTVIEKDVYKTGILPNAFYHGHIIHNNFSFKLN